MNVNTVELLRVILVCRGHRLVVGHLRKIYCFGVTTAIDFIKIQNDIHFCKSHLPLFTEKLKNSVQVLCKMSWGTFIFHTCCKEENTEVIMPLAHSTSSGNHFKEAHNQGMLSLNKTFYSICCKHKLIETSQKRRLIILNFFQCCFHGHCIIISSFGYYKHLK